MVVWSAGRDLAAPDLERVFTGLLAAAAADLDVPCALLGAAAFLDAAVLALDGADDLEVAAGLAVFGFLGFVPVGSSVDGEGEAGGRITAMGADALDSPVWALGSGSGGIFARPEGAAAGGPPGGGLVLSGMRRGVFTS